MSQTTEPKSRVDRIREAHPWVPKDTVHCLLVFAYKKDCKEPVNAGDDDKVQLYLENYTDVVVRMNKSELKNEIARVSEWFPDGFDLNFDDDDDTP